MNDDVNPTTAQIKTSAVERGKGQGHHFRTPIVNHTKEHEAKDAPEMAGSSPSTKARDEQASPRASPMKPSVGGLAKPSSPEAGMARLQQRESTNDDIQESKPAGAPNQEQTIPKRVRERVLAEKATGTTATTSVEAPPQLIENEGQPPLKRKRGRYVIDQGVIGGGGGGGSHRTNNAFTTTNPEATTAPTDPPKRGRGRPKGAKNKPKPFSANLPTEPIEPWEAELGIIHGAVRLWDQELENSLDYLVEDGDLYLLSLSPSSSVHQLFVSCNDQGKRLLIS